VNAAAADPGIGRVAEILASISLVTDLGMRQAPDEGLQVCHVATQIAQLLGVAAIDLVDVYYASLLHHIGCTATAQFEARHLHVDESKVRSVVSGTDFRRLPDVLACVSDVAREVPAKDRPATAIRLLTSGRVGSQWQAATCEVASATSRRVGLPDGVGDGLADQFERWDGKGGPRALAGDDISVAARITAVAALAVRIRHRHGVSAALAKIRRASGGWLDPNAAQVLLGSGREWLEELDDLDAFKAVLDDEPRPWALFDDSRLDQVCGAVADIVDLKSSYWHGHSSAVAASAEAAGRHLGLGPVALTTLRRAGLLHDLGRVAVPSRVWDRQGPLTSGELDSVRLHAYYTERVLSRCDAFKAYLVAGMHHERLDGSGYHRQLRGPAIAIEARIIAAADAFHAMLAPRPHRAAFSVDSAARELRAETKNGRLDEDAVEAVLASAFGSGQAGRARTRRTWPAGLSDREIEVLRLLCHGGTNQMIADQLVISRRTAEHHVQHLYAKIGVSSRPAAALFAMEHNLFIPGAQ